MYNKKMKDIPQFRPNSYGQMAIYCDDRTDHEFVMKCITHRREIEPQLPALDLKRDSEKNQIFLQAMKDTLAQPIQELSGVTKSQTDFLETQNKALQALLQNQHQPQMLENSYFSAGTLSTRWSPQSFRLLQLLKNYLLSTKKLPLKIEWKS